jgi:hypothetical protein
MQLYSVFVKMLRGLVTNIRLGWLEFCTPSMLISPIRAIDYYIEEYLLHKRIQTVRTFCTDVGKLHLIRYIKYALN